MSVVISVTNFDLLLKVFCFIIKANLNWIVFFLLKYSLHSLLTSDHHLHYFICSHVFETIWKEGKQLKKRQRHYLTLYEIFNFLSTVLSCSIFEHWPKEYLIQFLTSWNWDKTKKKEKPFQMSRRKMLKKKQLQCFIRKRVISKFYQDKIFFKKEKRNCFY